MDTYHWDVLVMHHWDIVGCFIWDLFEMSWRRTNGTSLLCPLKTSSRRSNKMSWGRTTETTWRRSSETSLGVSFEIYLLRCWETVSLVLPTELVRFGLRPATLLKRILWHRCFLMNFAKFLRTPFLQNTSGWLFLYYIVYFLRWPYLYAKILSNILILLDQLQCANTFGLVWRSIFWG